jgi:chitosanase
MGRVKKLLAAVALGVAATSSGVLMFRGQAAAETLLSKGRPAVASSIEGPQFAAGNAVDGDNRTRWASEEGVDPQWIQVDLGSVARVTRVEIAWEVAYARAFYLEASTDGTTWTAVTTTTGGDGGLDKAVVDARARLVRILGTERGTGYGYSMWELRVYGEPGVPGTGATGSATPTSPAGSATVSALPSASPSVSASVLPASAAPRLDLTDARKKDIAMQLVSSAENSSLDWRAQYAYIEDIGDGRGYTAGIIGFCSGTGDMLDVVNRYTRRKSGNGLAGYLPALRQVNGSASHAGLDPGFPADWKAAAADPVFQRTQDEVRDGTYFNPAVGQAKRDGLRALGQFAYYDAIVMHGPGSQKLAFGGIRAAALAKAKPPAQGGDETAFIHAFLDARAAAMRAEPAHRDTSRVETAQRVFLRAGNLDLNTPLSWSVYGESYRIG